MHKWKSDRDGCQLPHKEETLLESESSSDLDCETEPGENLGKDSYAERKYLPKNKGSGATCQTENGVVTRAQRKKVQTSTSSSMLPSSSQCVHSDQRVPSSSAGLSSLELVNEVPMDSRGDIISSQVIRIERNANSSSYSVSIVDKSGNSSIDNNELDTIDNNSSKIKKRKNAVVLPNHIRVITGETTTYLCTFCRSVFRTKYNYKSHEICKTGDSKHLKDKPFKGDTPHKSLKGRSGPPFKCSICDQMFPTISDCESHSVLHTCKNRFVCLECGSSYTSKQNLKIHMLRHSSSMERIPCKFCHRSFLTEKFLIYHLRRSHKLEQTNNNSRKYKRISPIKHPHSSQTPSYACDYCQKKFKWRCSLLLHQEKAHPMFSGEETVFKRMNKYIRVYTKIKLEAAKKYIRNRKVIWKSILPFSNRAKEQNGLLLKSGCDADLTQPVPISHHPPPIMTTAEDMLRGASWNHEPRDNLETGHQQSDNDMASAIEERRLSIESEFEEEFAEMSPHLAPTDDESFSQLSPSPLVHEDDGSVGVVTSEPIIRELPQVADQVIKLDEVKKPESGIVQVDDNVHEMSPKTFSVQTEVIVGGDNDTVFEDGTVKTDISHVDMFLKVGSGASRQKLEHLVMQKADWKGKNDNGESILHKAAAVGNVEALQYFISLGANIHSRSNKKRTPLHHAVFQSDSMKEAVNILLENGADINAEDYQGNNVLFVAVYFGRNDVEVEYIVSKGGDWRARNKLGYTILHVAANCGNTEALEYFISKGCNVNCVSSAQGATPLHQVAFAHQNFAKTLKILVDKNAKINAKDKDGNNVLFLATLTGRPVGELEILINYGCNYETNNIRGQRILHLAAQSSSLEVLKYFISKGTYVNSKSNDGRTPLHHLVYTNEAFSEKLEVLLEARACIRAVDNDGMNVVQIAVYFRKGRNVLEPLLRGGAEWTTKDKDGYGVLHLATERGNLDAVKYFVSLGANVNARGNMGETPLHRVVYAEENFIDIVNHLHQKDAILNAVDNDGNNLLFLAASLGRSRQELEHILTLGGDWTAKNNLKETILHVAARAGNVEAVKLFIEKGANVNCCDASGDTPLHCSIYTEKHFLSVAQVLASSGADINALNGDGNNLLVLSMLKGRPKEELENIMNLGGIGSLND